MSLAANVVFYSSYDN